MSINVRGLTPQHFLPRVVIAMAVLVTIASLFACDWTERKALSSIEETTIAFITTHRAILADVAYLKGFFKQEGLEVTPHLHPYGKPALQDMLKGSADFSLVTETPFMFAALNGANIVIIASIHKADKKNMAVVARKEKGIFAPSDLKGKKLATTFGTNAEFFLEAFLAINSISKQEIELVDLPQEDLPQALAEEKVDAVAAFNPFLLASQKQLGPDGATFYNDYIYTQELLIVSSQEFVQHNSQKVKKLLLALARAEEYVKNNWDEATKLVSDYSKMDVAVTREMLTGTSIGLSLDQSLLIALEDESRWAIKGRLTSASNIPNYLDYIYFEGLESVKPSAVKILK